MEENKVVSKRLTFKERIHRMFFLKTEIMHYRLNKASSVLGLLAILFNALMFLHIYGMSSCKADFYLGVDLVINIVFMLYAFLVSENQKKYDIKAGYLSIGLGVIEVLRIFFIPLKYLLQNLNDELHIKGLPMGDFVYVVVLMILASLCLIGAGIICIRKTKKLEKYLKENK